MKTDIKVIKSLKIPLLIIGVVLIFSFGFHAVNAASPIYVSPSGNDSWNGQNASHTTSFNKRNVDISTAGPKLTVKSGVSTISTNGILYLASGTYNENNIVISKNMTIQGTNTIINGNNKGRILTINSNVKVTISGITFINGNSTYGGAIYNSGTLTVNGCAFKNNTAQFGGAIYNLNTLNVFFSQFTSNSAKSATAGTYNGGAIYNGGTGNVNLDNATFTNNTATYGAAISHTGAKLVINKCTFNTNIASDSGGAIRTGTNTQTIVTSSTFNGNKANTLFAAVDYGYGGVLYNWGNTTMNNCNYTQNMAFEGGALYNKGNLNVNNGYFMNNSATSVAGAVDNAVGGIIYLNSCNFINNHADIYGGAIYNDNMAVYRANQYSTVLGNCTINILDCIFTNCTADDSGGAIENANGIVNISNSQLTYNTATNMGGAISNNGNGVLTISNSTLSNNTAGNYGGAINNIGALTINNCTLSNNKATNGGGVIRTHIDPVMVNNNTITINNSTFVNNTSKTGGFIYNIGGKLILTNNTLSGNGTTGIYNTS